MDNDDSGSSGSNPVVDVSAMSDLVTPMAIRVAATLRVADHIAAGLDTASALSGAAEADAGALDRLLRHLTAAGLLTRDADGRYELTARGEVLRDDHPGGLRRWLDIEDALGRAELSFVQLLHAVRSGDAAFPAQFGESFWDDLAGDPTRSASYDEQMGSDVAAWAQGIVSAYDWGSREHVVDVGGGDGTLMIELLTSYPTLRGTVLDQPATATIARERLAGAGFATRADAIGGSFFAPLPAGAGAYLLTAIIHDWADEPARAILRRGAEAAGTRGRVFVIEKIGTDGITPNSAMDLRMLAYLGGQERSVTALTALFEQSGLDVVTVHRAGAIVIAELVAR